MVDQAAFARIQTCVAAGDFSGGEDICARLAGEHADNPAFWVMRGDLALMAGKTADAEAHYRWATVLAPEAAKAWLGVARACVAGERNTAAGHAAQRALVLGLAPPDLAAAHEIMAHAHFAAGELDAGRGVLAALAPMYGEKMMTAVKPPPEKRLRSALPAAICAGDTVLVRKIMEWLYPLADRREPFAVAPVATLEEWCKQAGVACAVIDPSRRIKTEPTTPYSRKDSYKTEALLFASIPGGEWVPGWDFAIGSDGTVLEDTGYLSIVHVFNHAPHAHFPAAKLVAHHSPARTAYVDEDVLLLSAPMHNHFGYWLNDFFPRLLGRAHAGPKTKIAVPEDLTDAKFMELFALAGIGEQDIVRCRRDTRYRFRTLHLYRGSVRPHPSHSQFLRSTLYNPAMAPVRTGKSKRFFLSRDRIGTRLAINAAEFAQCLRDNDFITVELSDLSVSEQRRLFADAEVLLSALGTDMFAMYFAPPGCTVIAMQWNAGLEIDPYAPAMCKMAGMKHQYLLCPQTQPSKGARHWLDLDFVVDCAELTRRMREMEAPRGA